MDVESIRLLMFAALLAYFIPTAIVLSRKPRKRNAAAIIWLNLLTGWTVIGWIASFIWAMTNDAPIGPESQANYR